MLKIFEIQIILCYEALSLKRNWWAEYIDNTDGVGNQACFIHRGIPFAEVQSSEPQAPETWPQENPLFQSKRYVTTCNALSVPKHLKRYRNLITWSNHHLPEVARKPEECLAWYWN